MTKRKAKNVAPEVLKANGKSLVPEAIREAVGAARTKRKAPGELGDGPFVVTALARSAGFEGLPLRPGSARFELMAAIFDRPKGLMRAEIANLIGAQAGQVLRGTTRYGFLTEAS